MPATGRSQRACSRTTSHTRPGRSPREPWNWFVRSFNPRPSPEGCTAYLEGRAIEIVAETIAALTRTDRQTDDRMLLGRNDLQRLRRAKELIHARLAEPLSVEVVARGSGTSTSGLQRIFRVSEGSSVFEYIRLQRLEHAFAALRSGEASVQRASDIAGYASPTNFATAFRRRFGLTPRDAMKSDRAGRKGSV